MELKSHGKRQEDVQHDGLHRIEAHVSAQAGVPDDPEVEGEEGDEARVGDGAVEAHEREKGFEGEGERRVGDEEVAAVLNPVEEGEEVGGGGDEPLGGRDGVIRHGNDGLRRPEVGILISQGTSRGWEGERRGRNEPGRRGFRGFRGRKERETEKRERGHFTHCHRKLKTQHDDSESFTRFTAHGPRGVVGINENICERSFGNKLEKP
ncbi:hypothetical protein H6P81_016018 [Aristolochia fimbriata]|uniref:Uncharacterized protein n=1 Tax=Aristolochia fimbriata TaxID=158543 RepID=A0AAV7EBR7_ARIFI|nr:hypothetical protein H6P81_016018 [Aristolochia fimbriata]